MMKAYLAVSGSVFGLVTVAHIWRAVYETHLATEFWFILLTVISAGLSAWAFRLWWRLRA